MRPLRYLYHLALKLVLRLFGMDFGWYRNSYVKWPYDVLDALLSPGGVARFGVYLVECHAGKMPSLTRRHRKDETEIARLNLGDRVFHVRDRDRFTPR